MRHEDRAWRRATRKPIGASEAQLDELRRIDEEMQHVLAADAEPENSYAVLANARDMEAIADERAFRRRFWFDWSKRDRQALIDLKHRRDLTDRQIKLMKWTGNLRRKEDTITLAANRGIAIFGRCVIVLMFLEFVIVMLPVVLVPQQHPPSLCWLAKLWGAAAYVIALAWAVRMSYIQPWIIQRRVFENTQNDVR